MQPTRPSAAQVAMQIPWKELCCGIAGDPCCIAGRLARAVGCKTCHRAGMGHRWAGCKKDDEQ